MTMNDEGDLSIENSNASKSFEVTFVEKKLNGYEIYSLLDYSNEKTYSLITNVDEVKDERKRAYFTEIISVFSKIIESINNLNCPEERESVTQ